MRFNARWGKRSISDYSRAERVDRLVKGSELDVVIDGASVSIQISGELAILPILKNRKLPPRFPGQVILNPGALDRIMALDLLFAEHLERSSPPGEPVFISRILCPVSVVIIMSDSQTADRISVLETVQDWLEPAEKKVGSSKKKPGRDRGWGIGLIANDSQVIGSSYRASDIGPASDSARILIRPFREVKDLAVQYIARHITG